MIPGRGFAGTKAETGAGKAFTAAALVLGRNCRSNRGLCWCLRSKLAQQNQLNLNRVFAALYKGPPQGFEEAIAIGEPLLRTEQASNGQLHLWMACAYGQRTLFRQQQGEASE